MAKTSDNRFEIHGDTVSIYREDKGFIGRATYRSDYHDELTMYTWNKNDRYVTNQKFGTLHKYMMIKWYGEDTYNYFREQGYVIDHLNNDSSDCRIFNLSFLPEDENKAKGFTVDKQRKNLVNNIALNVFKDFSTDCFQITIGFNDNVYLKNLKTGSIISVTAIKFLYNIDYREVINDIRTILLSYENRREILFEKLSFFDMKITEVVSFKLTNEEKNSAVVERNGKAYLVLNENTRLDSVHYDKEWKPKE